MPYQPAIGLEIHAELKTKTKMFCSCKNNPDEKEANKNICPVCMAHPGTLPTINEQAVKKVLKTGLALNCQIPELSRFDRKNYFYPDLPKGYQISQYQFPLCNEGFLEINNYGENIDAQKFQITNDKPVNNKFQIPKIKKVRIRRIHLEEDTGKLLHPENTDETLVDFNRAGVPLMELVTEPDIKSGKEARKLCEELQLILRYLDVSHANMEKGEMRCEVNISLREITDQRRLKTLRRSSGQADTHRLGTKVEIKNLNSFRAVERAIDYEIKRQAVLLDEKEKIVQETRGWDENAQKTYSQRSKEEAHDYRYFPEPDLPPVIISREIPTSLDKIKKEALYLPDLKKEIPELPAHRRQRFNQEYNLPQDQIEILTSNKELGEYFEKVSSELQEWINETTLKNDISKPEAQKLYRLCANYLITELQKLTGESEKEKDIEKITAENFAELIKMIYRREISSSAAQEILKIMYQTSGDPSRILEEKGLKQVSDQGELEKIIQEVINSNPKPVIDYQKGNQNAIQFLVGQVMKASRGKANPEVVKEILKKQLAN